MPERSITEIGKYKILGIVGEGAMGVVYRATDSVLKRTVAIKVMSDSIARQQDLRDRFLREAQAAGSMQHPNVVSIYDLGEMDGHLFIAMEFVEGVDLEQLIRRAEPLTLQTKLDIIIDVLGGLGYAHKRGIVHRDIKPANIRIAEDGRAKIMDFGVAHLSSSTLTATGMVVGTPAYMSPEQVTGMTTTAATDLFSTGTVLYELVTGLKAFAAPTLQSLFYKIVAEEPVAMDALMPVVPVDLIRIVAKALEKNPADRYQTALEMANDISRLRATMSGAPQSTTVSLNASVASAIAQKQHASVRNRQLAIGGGALAVVLVAAFLFMSSRQPRISAEVSPPPSPAATTSNEIAAANPAPNNPPAIAPHSPEPALAPTPPTKTETRKPTKAESRVAAPQPPPKTVVKPAPPVSRPAVIATQPSTLVTLPPAPNPAPAPAAAPVPAPAPTPAPAPPSAPSPSEVGAAVEAYARAIESKDISAVRRVYPGLTASQQSGFEQFFQAARRINVTFRVSQLEGTGSTAEARLVGTYDYTTTEGKTERQPANFAATLRHDVSGWKLTSVR